MGGETGVPTTVTDGQGMARSCWSLDVMDGACMEVEVKVRGLTCQAGGHSSLSGRTHRKSGSTWALWDLSRGNFGLGGTALIRS